MDELIDKILEIQRLSREVNERVCTCTFGYATETYWHIYGFDNFINVANELNNGKFIEEDTDSGLYSWKYSFECRGIEVFCLSRNKMEVHKDV